MSPPPLRGRIRDLARAGKLDAYLPEAEGVAGIWSLWFGIANWFALVAAGIAVARFALAERPAGADPDFDDPAIYAALLLLLFAGLCWLLARLTVPRSERRRRRLGRRGVLVPAAIVQVNAGWHEPDNDQSWPGSVVVSFDPQAWQRAGSVQDVARAAFARKQADRRELPDDEVLLAWTLYHELGPHRAVRVPAALCQGLADCWLVSVQVPPRLLQHEGAAVVLALPGETAPEAFALLPAALGSERG